MRIYTMLSSLALVLLFWQLLNNSKGTLVSATPPSYTGTFIVDSTTITVSGGLIISVQE